MTRAYRIVEWNQRYEVDESGRAAKPGTPVAKLRKGALAYFREPVFGRRPGPSARRAMRMAVERIGNGGDVLVFGLWLKLQEVASQERAGLRGWILDERSQPVDLRRFAEMVGFEWGKHLEEAMQILMDAEVAWVEHVEFCGKVREDAGRCGIPQEDADALLTKTKDKAEQNIPKPKGDLDLAKNSPVGDLGLEARRKAKNEIAAILNVRMNNTSEVKTFKHIFEQIDARVKTGELGPEIFGRMVKEAKGCVTAWFPKKAFVTRMKKEPYNFIPQKQRGGRVR